MAHCQLGTGYNEFHAVLNAYVTQQSGGVQPADFTGNVGYVALRVIPGILRTQSRTDLLAGEPYMYI